MKVIKNTDSTTQSDVSAKIAPVVADTATVPIIGTVGTDAISHVETKTVDSETLHVLEVLSVASIYASLSALEQERVFNFITDAKERDRTPVAALQYAATEEFNTVVQDLVSGYSQEDISHELGLPMERIAAYAEAWRLISSPLEPSNATRH